MDNMSLGTGIFWGLVALSFVILIVATKDKWKWGRIIAVIIGLPALGVIAITGYEYYDSLPQQITEIGNIPLDATYKEVAYWLDEPVSSKPRESDSTYTTNLYKLAEGGYIYISFKEGTSRRIIYDGEYDSDYTVNGVWVSMSENSVIGRLGEVYEVYNFPDNRRCYIWRELNSFAIFSKGICEAVGIQSPDYLW